MGETIILAITSFLGTNLDDLLLTVLLFLQSRDRSTGRAILLGKYAGLAILVGISRLAAVGLQTLPGQWLGLLGLVPLTLGLWQLLQAFRNREQEDALPVATPSVWSVTLITLANGADNLGVYTPLFVEQGTAQWLITLGIYGILVWVWWLVGRSIGGHPRLQQRLERHKIWLVPLIYGLLGLYILGKHWL